MMVNGWNLVDITIGEARKLLVKAMNDHKVSGLEVKYKRLKFGQIRFYFRSCFLNRIISCNLIGSHVYCMFSLRK